MSTPIDDDDLVRRLRALRVDPPGGKAFGAALHLRLAGAGAPRAPSRMARLGEALRARPAAFWPLVGTACGVLAGALVFLALGQLARHGVERDATAARPPATTLESAALASGDVAPTYLVPSSKVAVIKLNFAASVDVADVDFEVELPEGLAFWSGGKKLPERTFRWPGELRAGDNLIPIAVRGERPGLFRVKARAIAGGDIVEHAVLLDVRGGA